MVLCQVHMHPSAGPGSSRCLALPMLPCAWAHALLMQACSMLLGHVCSRRLGAATRPGHQHGAISKAALVGRDLSRIEEGSRCCGSAAHTHQPAPHPLSQQQRCAGVPGCQRSGDSAAAGRASGSAAPPPPPTVSRDLAGLLAQQMLEGHYAAKPGEGGAAAAAAQRLSVLPAAQHLGWLRVAWPREPQLRLLLHVGGRLLAAASGHRMQVA